jgi:CubicO group peptidase (beta-lactamase class C family)
MTHVSEVEHVSSKPRSAWIVILAAWVCLAHAEPHLADQAADVAANPAVDELFREYDNAEAPGCALGVIRDGEFIYRRGYGMANLEHGIALTPQSVFDIASTSKQFTAAVIALLAEAGVVGLDDPLRRYFPEFPAWADAITLRQLIHHTSGIRDYLQLAFLAGRGGDADHYTDAWVIELLARQQATNFPAGEQHLYSNSGYLLLAHVVQRATGQTLRDYAGEHVFGPLGMTRTHFHDNQTQIVPGRATGYAPAEDGYRISMTTLDMVGDGGVYTTIEDLLQWDRNFYDNRLGGPDLIERLTTPGKLNDGTPLDYAFGLAVEESQGLRMVSHGGAFVGYRSELVRFPEQRLSVAVLCNRADAAAEQLALAVARHYLPDALAAPAPGETPAAAPELLAPLSELELGAYAGDFWEDAEAFAAETRVEDGKLWAVHSPERRNELRPVGPDAFAMVGVPAEVLVYFERDGERITGMRRNINGKPRGVFRPFTRRQAGPQELDAYTGSYFSGELDVSYTLRLDGAKLLFRVTGQTEEELTAMFGETFENPDYGAFDFERAPDGRVTSFKLQSGRVRNLAFVRL